MDSKCCSCSRDLLLTIRLSVSLLALTVGVGSERDPRDFVGFTHLIEHLLFTGSKNYPESHHIEKIVNKYHGEQNGVTKAFSTSFMFRVEDQGLEEFIPAFADAIKEPLFSVDNIKKEINNVNSEISMRMTYNKNLAYYKLLKAIGNPQSKIYSDGFANIDAEKWNFEELHEQIVDFHKTYYSANIMTLTIISERKFLEVKELVESNFASIQNNNVKRPLFNDPGSAVLALEKESLGKVYYLQGFTEPTHFSMVFQLKSELDNPTFHPLQFFNMFLGYFSENSFRETLIKEGLITALSSDIVMQDYVNALYMVNFSLTSHGKKNISKIIKHFFRFVNYVKNLPDKAAIFESISKTSKYAFLFSVKSKYVDFSGVEEDVFERCVNFSETLQDYPPEMIFTVNNVMFKYDEKLFEDNLKYLEPTNAIYIIESPEFKTESVIEVSPEQKVHQQKIQEAIKNDMNTLGHSKKTLKHIKSKSIQYHPLSRSLMQLSNTQPETETTLEGLFDTKYLLQGYRGASMRRLSLIPIKKSRLGEDNYGIGLNRRLTNQKDGTKVSYSAFFDDVTDSILPYAFEFDNHRRYNSVEVTSEIFDLIKQEVDRMDIKYETCKRFKTDHLDYYRIINNCETPVSLIRESGRERNTNGLLTIESVKVQMSGDHNAPANSSLTIGEPVYTPIVFDAIFENVANPKGDMHDRQKIIQDLLLYKICLVNEFSGDDKQTSAKIINDSAGLRVYHTLFRRTLQPKAIVSATIESSEIIANVMRANFDARLKLLLKMEMLCLYIIDWVELKFHDEFMKANDFSCEVINYRIVLKFEGISDQIQEFISTVLANFEIFNKSDAFEEYILRNFRRRIVELYSQFNAITPLNLSSFYLSLIMDKIMLDNSSPEKVKQIKALVDSISADDLASVMDSIMRYNKIIVLAVGNIETTETQKIGQIMKKALVKHSSASKDNSEMVAYRKFITENFVTKIPPKSHFVIRLPNLDHSDSNSVYLTFFKIHKISRTTKLEALILNHYLAKTVYKVMRNELNLGYVAHSELKDFYHNLGLIVLVQGENFRPHNIETQIDGMIEGFLQEMRSLTNEDLDKVKNHMLENLIEFSAVLEDVHEKYYMNVEEQILHEDSMNYTDIAAKINPRSLYQFAEDFFVKNQRRLTIELFASKITKEEHDFRMPSTFSLDKKPYTLKTIDELVAMKTRNF